MDYKINISELESLTGKSYRYLKARLKNIKSIPGDKGSINYDCREVIAQICKFTSSTDGMTLGEVQFGRQKAEMRLAEAKAKKIELEIAIQEGKIILTEDAKKLWSTVLGVFKSQLNNLPPKIALRLTHIAERYEVEALVNEVIKEVLDELSEFNGGFGGFDGSSERAETVQNSDTE